MSRKRANHGMSREAWREHKRANGIVTYWDRNEGFYQPPAAPRSDDAIRADAARMLSAQMRAQRDRWGFA